MLYLVLSLMFVPSVNAYLQVHIQGEHQIDDFRQVNDTTNVIAYTDYNSTAIVSGSNKLYLDCVPGNNTGFICGYEFPRQQQSIGRHTLKLVKEGPNPESLVKEYYVDGYSPVFSSIRMRQSANNLKVDYSLIDKSSSSVTECSGLKDLTLMVGGNALATKELTRCSSSDSIQAELPSMEGETEIYLVARDNLDNVGYSETESLFIDTRAPIIPGSYELLRDGLPVTRIGEESNFNVDVVFSITENSLEKVEVDISALLGGESNKKIASCTKNSELQSYDCIIKNIPLKAQEENLVLQVTATDRKGNVAEGSISYDLEYIDENSKVTYIGKENNCENCYLKSGENELIAKITSQAGFDRNQLFFEVDNIISKNTNCTEVGTWECKSQINLLGLRNGDSKIVKIHSSSKDDADYSLRGELEKTMIVDNVAPTLEIVNGRPNVLMDSACPVAGQQLKLWVKTYDDLSDKLYIYGNFSEISSRTLVASECESLGNKEFNCELTIDSFMSKATDVMNIPVTIEDVAGNKIDFLVPIELCEADSNTLPNFISSVEVDDDSLFLDKRIASLIPFRIDVPLKINYFSGSNARISQKITASCFSNEVSAVNGEPSLLGETSKNQKLSTYFFYQGVWPENKLTVNCTIDYQMRQGNIMYMLPEKESFNFTLDLQGEEIGNPGTAIINKKRALVKQIIDLQETVKKKKKIDDSIGKACNMVTNLGNVNIAMQAVKSVLGALAIALYAAFGIGEGIWKAAHFSLGSFHHIVTTYLWPPGFLYSPEHPQAWIGFSVKWICSLYTCAFYDAQTIAAVAGEAIANHYAEGDQEVITSYDSEEDFNAAYGDLTREGSGVDVRSMWVGRIGGEGVFTSQIHKSLAQGQKAAIAYNLPKDQQKAMLIQGQQSANGFSTNIAEHFFDEGSMIVDPYKNAAYDGLCIPAQLYNAQKEKQLKCMQIKCINTMSERGLPIDMCDEQADVLECLYVEGAFSRTNDFGEILMKGLVKVGMALAMNWLMTFLYSKKGICGQYYSALFVKDGTIDQASKASWCGVIGAFLGYNELTNFMDSPWAKHDNSLPTNYCSDLSEYGITDGVEE